jgi:hypothetical protein
MISLLPIGRVIGLVSVVYAVLIVIAVAISWKFGNRSQTVWDSVGIAWSGATVRQRSNSPFWGGSISVGGTYGDWFPL